MDDKLKQIAQYHKSMKKHVEKQKLRDARRKSGTKTKDKKPRRKAWRSDTWEEWDELDFPIEERVMPRGSAERRRRVENLAKTSAPRGTSAVTADPRDASSSLGSATDQSGLVVEVSSGMCRVEINDKIILCTMRRNLKNAGSNYTNPIAVGDRVLIRQDGDKQGVVEEVLPRDNFLARSSTTNKGRSSGQQQILVANIGRLLIVASWRDPIIWPELIDRYLIAAQRNELRAVICINKVDLVEDRSEFEDFQRVYSGLGYEFILTSAVTGQGISELQSLLKQGTTVLAGLSGVGKSSLLTAVQPNLNLRTAHVSQRGLFTGQGRHTTTQSSLFRLDDGGVVIDTPGIREFGLIGIAAGELAHWYSEMEAYLGDCRFQNCSHTSEPDCAIIKAVDAGMISPLRYKNFQALYEELRCN